ncbi:MAG TPA: hypothetical protein VGG12_03930, partial [Methylovirgula sp.]
MGKKARPHSNQFTLHVLASVTASKSTAHKPRARSKAPAHDDKAHGDMEPVVEVTQREIKDIEDRSSPRPPVIYEIVRRQGEEEMARPIAALWWSGLAAGLSISTSLVAQAM